MKIASQKIYGLSDAWPLNKHKGESVQAVMEKDPSYFLWVLENVMWLKFTPEVVNLAEQIEEDNDDDFYPNFPTEF